MEPGLPHVLRWHHLGLGWRLVLVGVAEPHRAQEEVGAVNVNTGGHTRDAQLPATQIAMPRTRSETEAATARQFVLSSADLLPIIFNNLGAQALCRSACVNKLWRRMDMDARWTVLLAARWPNTKDNVQATLREADDYRALGGSKALYRQHFEDHAIADLVFLVELRWKDVLADEEEEEEDDYVLIDPRVGVFPGLFGDFADDSSLEIPCLPPVSRALTYMVRGFMSEFPAEGEEDAIDAPVHPATAVEAFDAMPPGEIECSVTVNFANGATSGRKKFNMNEIIEGTFVATEDGDAFLHPTTQVPLSLGMRLVPQTDAAGAVHWTATFDLGGFAAHVRRSNLMPESMMKTLVENSTGWAYDDSYEPYP